MTVILPRREVLIGATAALVAPAAQAKAPKALNFLVIGDWGVRGGQMQRAVARQMGVTARESGAQFVLTVGDNFYSTGVASVTDSHWAQSFESVYTDPALQIPWYPALGNHDYQGETANPDAQVAYKGTTGRWRMPARFYARKVALPGGRTLELFNLDTTLHLTKRPQDEQLRAAQIAWFEPALMTSQADWKLVYGHHTVFSNGGLHGNNSTLISWLKPKLEAAGVQAYICGHDHDLQHIVSGPVNYIISGGGMEARAVNPAERWGPGARFAKAAPGFAVCTIEGEAMSVRWIDQTGAEVGKAEIARRAAMTRA
jgi:tartrate-resistant acid phosphatase type 5